MNVLRKKTDYTSTQPRKLSPGYENSKSVDIKKSKDNQNLEIQNYDEFLKTELKDKKDDIKIEYNKDKRESSIDHKMNKDANM